MTEVQVLPTLSVNVSVNLVSSRVHALLNGVEQALAFLTI